MTLNIQHTQQSQPRVHCITTPNNALREIPQKLLYIYKFGPPQMGIEWSLSTSNLNAKLLLFLPKEVAPSMERCRSFPGEAIGAIATKATWYIQSAWLG